MFEAIRRLRARSLVTFQIGVAVLPHEKILQATELIGSRLAPLLREWSATA
ncbi:MAG: hypothetical protein ACRYG7_03400 [Janthinobacterium lividum]